jgi:tetratricopeptide (TPR) repeat protein
MSRALVALCVILLLGWGNQAARSQESSDVQKGQPADNRVRLERWRAIRDSLSNVLTQMPNEWSAWVNRGFANAQLKNYSDALHDYSKAIWLAPREVNAYLHRASLYFALADFANARKDLDTAITIEQKDAQLFYYRGLCRVKLKDDAGAIEDFSRSLRIKVSPEAFYERGLAKARFQRYSEAIYDFDNALELDKQFAFAYYARGRAKLAIGQHSEALLDLSRAQLLGCAPAGYLLSQYIEKSETLDSLRIYASPEITVRATREEIQRATETTKNLASIGVTAINTTNFQNPRSKLFRVGTMLFNSGITINDAECNEKLVQTRGATQVSIFCIIHLLKKQAAILNDPKVNSLINQLSNLVALFEDRMIDERQFLTEIQNYVVELDTYMKRKY